MTGFVSAQLVVETVEESVWGEREFGILTQSLRAWILVFFLTSFFFFLLRSIHALQHHCFYGNESLLTVAISPVRSAACTSTSLRVLAAVDRSTELKCFGPFVPRCK